MNGEKVLLGSSGRHQRFWTKSKDPSTALFHDRTGSSANLSSVEQQIAEMVKDLEKKNERFLVIGKQEPYLEFLRNYRKQKKRKGFRLPVYMKYEG